MGTKLYLLGAKDAGLSIRGSIRYWYPLKMVISTS
jgi:hypothetical protein